MSKDSRHSATGNGHDKKKLASLAIGALVLPATIAAPACSPSTLKPDDPTRAQDVAEVYGPANPSRSDDGEDGQAGNTGENDNSWGPSNTPKISAMYGPAER